MGKLRLPRLISDGMVLQHKKRIHIWGWDEPGRIVTAKFSGDESSAVTAETDENGSFSMYLEPCEPGGPYDVMLTDSAKECCIIHDVLIGDVYFCSGQSNMELPMSRVKDKYPDEVANCKNDNIRTFKITEHADFHEPLTELLTGEWVSAAPDTIMNFSATGYFFAEELYAMTGVPVGFIDASLGGSRLESWLSRDMITCDAPYPQVPDIDPEGRSYDEYEDAKKRQRQEWLEVAKKYADDDFVAGQLEKNERQNAEWHAELDAADEGLIEGWSKLTAEDIYSLHKVKNDWKTTSIPFHFKDTDLKDFIGSVWFCRNFDVPEHLAGRAMHLWLGTIVDSDTAYVNGVEVGHTEYQYPPRKYEIPEDLLKTGENSIVVRVKVENGLGRFTPGKRYAVWLDEDEIDLTGVWNYRIGASCEKIPETDFVNWKPTGLYNGMTAPCHNYTIAGIAWYQGESNAEHPDNYLEAMKRLIGCYRQKWQDEDLPFYYVQLPNFEIDLPEDGGGWPEIREKQRQAQAIPNAYMATAIDIGEDNDLHPLNKKDVGKRLARLAVRRHQNREKNAGFEQAWLQYKRIRPTSYVKNLRYILCNKEDLKSPIVKSAVEELQLAWDGLFGKKLEVLESVIGRETSGTGIVMSTYSKSDSDNAPEKPGGYIIRDVAGSIVITAQDDSGLLYGAFALLRMVRTGRDLTDIMSTNEPDMPLRMLDHWDNMDGSIERGYSGNSFFFKDNKIIVDERTKAYARLISSIGINAVVINNVNVGRAETDLITDKCYGKLTQLSEIFAAYGVKLYMSLNYAAPVELGELDTADPLDEDVKAWWRKKMQEVFARVPNFGGFLIKADSEGRPGPFTYGRTHADGANMLADAVAPYGGIIIWRCFVYNCQQDWRDRKTDRARSGYDNFHGLDGQFRDNVILRIKNGPMDFQIREPVHPLFGGMTQTNEMLEVQIAQEYTGQQRQVCYLIPMFKEILDFRTYVNQSLDTVRDIVAGKTFGQTNCGMAAVTNTGDDENWTGHDLAAANLYGFGRLAFDTSLSSEDIASEWIELTFGDNERVAEVLSDILLKSREVYEKYSAPLGVGWMVNPAEHYGPSVDGYEYDRWGTYHYADHLGVGVDRTISGTGYASLYHRENAEFYENLETCPDELLLFFHHVPYTHRLHSGKTVLQHIYDTHFEGVEMVDEMVSRFESLRGLIDDRAFDRMHTRFMHQKENAREWRDQINSYFYRKTGIDDEKGRTIY